MGDFFIKYFTSLRKDINKKFIYLQYLLIEIKKVKYTTFWWYLIKYKKILLFYPNGNIFIILNYTKTIDKFSNIT